MDFYRMGDYKDQVPAIVMNALQASEYKNYTIDDIDLIENRKVLSMYSTWNKEIMMLK